MKQRTIAAGTWPSVILSVYDAMIVAAAQRANVKLLYSEDMQDGLAVEGGLTVRNPFAG